MPVDKDVYFDLIRSMISTTDLNEFSSSFLHKLAEFTGAEYGSFYTLSGDGREFCNLTSVGLDLEAFRIFHDRLFEPEFGKALVSRKLLRSGIKSFGFESELKDANMALPSEVLTVPIIAGSRCEAILSLAGTLGFSDEVLDVLERIRQIINISYSNILANENKLRLANELHEKNRLLELQKDELENRTYELKKQTEKVIRQNIELEEQKKIVEESNKLKTEFLSNMSHELRTPLNSILSLSRVLSKRSEGRLSDEEMNYLEIIERNGKSLLALINDILDLSRIDAGRIELNPKKISVASIIGQIAETYEQMAAEKGVKMISRISENMPLIESDEIRLYHIFQNIIGNAVKFTEKGSVTISSGHDEEFVSVEIRDTGIGIDEKNIGKIFDEFRQLDGTLSRMYEGTGLGLAIALKSVNLVSGAIAVKSEHGKGSSFIVTLPVSWHGGLPAEVSGRAGSRPADAERNSDPGERKREILVIEDDPDAIVMLKAVLQGDYNVVEAQDGETGVDMAMKRTPDLVLLDIVLGGMNGFEVMGKFAESGMTSGIPVIAMTGLSKKDDIDKISGLGFADYLIKPFQIEELRKKVDKWIAANNEKDTGNRR
jgi:signal transduction histidine kinase/ActR/RegA family two-component response regulator